MMLFLESLGEFGNVAGLGALLLLGTGMVILAGVLAVGMYIYFALALRSIAKKTRTEPSWLAWIPIVNIYLITKIAGMHWWPMLLLIGYVIPLVNIVAMIVLAVFYFIWMWKVFEAVGRPGWWILLILIPFAGQIIYFVLLGIAAWGSSQTHRHIKKQ